MPFGISAMAKSSVDQEIRRKGQTIGLAEAFAKGYVAVYAEVYAATFAEGYAAGVVEHARETLLRHGAKKLGPPNEQVVAEITVLADLDHLYELTDRILEVSSWDELLSPPDLFA